MAEIYQQANLVMIWLGSYAEDTGDVAMNHFEHGCPKLGVVDWKWALGPKSWSAEEWQVLKKPNRARVPGSDMDHSRGITCPRMIEVCYGRKRVVWAAMELPHRCMRDGFTSTFPPTVLED